MQKMFNRLHNTDAVISMLLLALSIWIYWYAGFLITENTKPIAAHTFPRALAIMLAGMSIVVLVQSFSSQPDQSGKPSHTISGLSPTLFVIVIMVSLIIYALIMPIIGFIITSVIAMLVWMRLMGIRHWGVLLGFSIGVVFAVYGLFQIILQVPLP